MDMVSAFAEKFACAKKDTVESNMLNSTISNLSKFFFSNLKGSLTRKKFPSHDSISVGPHDSWAKMLFVKVKHLEVISW